MLFQTNSLNVNIRSANTDDIDQIYEIEKTSYGKHHWSKQAFLKELTNSYTIFYVAELFKNMERIIIGYISMWKIGSEGHITTLAIHDSYKRQHAADILLYNLIKTAVQNNIKWLTLEVRASNTPAIKLYTKHKFKQLGLRKKYYQDNNEDALILWTNNITDSSYIKLLEERISTLLVLNPYTDKLQYCNTHKSMNLLC